MTTAATPQEAIHNNTRYVLPCGPNHADARLVIDNGELSIEAPGVDTKLTVDIVRKIAYICGGWLAMQEDAELDYNDRMWGED